MEIFKILIIHQLNTKLRKVKALKVELVRLFFRFGGGFTDNIGIIKRSVDTTDVTCIKLRERTILYEMFTQCASCVDK